MLDAYRDLIDELLETPTEIRALIARVDEGEITSEVRRSLAEMRDRDLLVLERARAMTAKDHAYLQDIVVGEETNEREVETLLGELEAARGDLVSLLINLSLKDWERTAFHEIRGELTLAEEIEEHVDYDESQRGRLRALLERS